MERARRGIVRCRRTLARWLGGRRSPALRLIAPAVLVAVLAVVVRCLYVADVTPRLHTAEQPGVRMAARYSEAASALIEGDGILYPRVWPDRSDTGLLSRPPGYPAFLAAVYRTVGRRYVDVLVVQALVAALLAPLVLLTATRVAGRAAGLFSGLLAASSPQLAFHAALVTPDALGTLLAVCFVALLWRGRRRPGPWFLAAGVVAGAATWLRPNLLLLAPLLGPASVLALGRPRRTLRWVLVLVAVAGGVVAPITLRNLRVYGELVPVSTNMGIVLWEGIADAGGERFGARQHDLEVAEEEAWRFGDARYASWWASPDGIRRDRDRVARSLAVVRENPVWFASACLRRVPEILAADTAAPRLAATAPDLPQATVEGPPAWVRWRLGVLRRAIGALQEISTRLALPLRALGLAVILVMAPRRAVLLLLAPLYVLLMQSPLHFEPRFALPLHAFSPVFEGIGWAFLLALGLRGARRARKTAAGPRPGPVR